MLISHKHKFIFFHIPKTGGNSIQNALAPFADILPNSIDGDIYNHHVRPNRLKERFEQRGWNFDEYFKFAFFRNPWSFALSIWTYAHKCKKQWQNQDTSNFGNQGWVKNVESITSFNTYSDFCRQCIKQDNQYNFVFDKNGTKTVDLIGTLENLQSDLDNICNKIGIPHQNVGHDNQSNSKNYIDYYDQKSIEHVASIFHKTIAYKNYKFGE